MTIQTIQLSIKLDTDTLRWVNQVAYASDRSLEMVIADLLTIIACPESLEDELIDKLLKSAVKYFPAIMELDEQEEMSEEVIDHLCTRLLEVASNSNSALTSKELEHLREKLRSRSEEIWSAN